MRNLLLILACSTLLGCQSAYYSAAESLGIHKRDILVDRVEEAGESQEDASEQFQSALEQFSVLVNFDGGDLEDVYEDLNDEYEDSLAAAEEVRARIDSVENVAEALFDEWATEIEQYNNANYKRESQRQLRETRTRYNGMVSAMRKAEKRMDPVLSSLHDNVLFLKHNLNARAVASLKTEFSDIQQDVQRLIAEMQKSIDESNAFIASLQQSD